VQACGVANIYRVEDLLHLATGKQPTSSLATYELSPRCHRHHHQAAIIIYPCSLRRSGHNLSQCAKVNLADAAARCTQKEAHEEIPGQAERKYKAGKPEASPEIPTVVQG
jgi:hypothetical protein